MTKTEPPIDSSLVKRVQQAFHEADEAEMDLDKCWEAAIRAMDGAREEIQDNVENNIPHKMEGSVRQNKVMEGVRSDAGSSPQRVAHNSDNVTPSNPSEISVMTGGGGPTPHSGQVGNPSPEIDPSPHPEYSRGYDDGLSAGESIAELRDKMGLPKPVSVDKCVVDGCKAMAGLTTHSNDPYCAYHKNKSSRQTHQPDEFTAALLTIANGRAGHRYYESYDSLQGVARATLEKAGVKWK